MVDGVNRSILELFNKAYVLAKLVAITPLFNAKTKRERLICKIYSIFHVVAILVAQCYHFSLNLSLQENLYDIYYTTIFIHSISVCASFLQHLVTILGAAYWNRDKWGEFYNIFPQIESFLYQKDDTFFIKYFDGILILTNICIICLSGLSIASMIMSSSFLDYSFYIITYYYMLCENVKMLLIYAYLCSIQQKSINLRELLEKRYTQKRAIPLSVIGTLYRQMYDTTKLFNSLFGLQILLSLAQGSCMCLESMNMIWKYVTEKSDSLPGLSIPEICLNLLLSLITAIKPIVIIFGCNSVTDEAQTIIGTSYRYQEDFNVLTDEKRELLNLVYQAIYNKPVFTAAGFFDLDRGAVFALFGTAFTYFFILIQFNHAP